CTASDELNVFVDRRGNVFLPNVFSPNGDGANDVFFVNASPRVLQVDALQVFSRWGEPVFEAFNFPPNDPQFGWDGTYRGQPLNSAVFVVQVTVSYIDGAAETFSQEVILMK
ncbi:T9SS type B sorting domain-containing protein, partial [Phaeodactylibacter luteus]